ncbi:hypothetical protein LG276_01080 [Cytobacillus kochii]|uniref:hypothetical protein n=1 Tax=Cytobacillus kochii TaxID=859143 RepID=UPI00384DBDED
MEFNKEVTYIFNYAEEMQETNIYVDSLVGRRHVENPIDIYESYSCFYKGTGQPYQVINCELVAVFDRPIDTTDSLYIESEEKGLVFYLSDINLYAEGFYRIRRYYPDPAMEPEKDPTIPNRIEKTLKVNIPQHLIITKDNGGN